MQRQVQNWGGGVTVTRVGPKGATSVFSAPNGRRCTKPGCHGELEPSVDRRGASVSECAKCGEMYPIGGGSALSGSVTPARPCSVKKCPGRLDTTGQCSCCAKRDRFLEQHLPKRFCGICEGEIKGAKKFCGACAPINTKVNAAKKKAAA